MLSGFAEKFREESFKNIPQESDHQPKPHSSHVQNLDVGCFIKCNMLRIQLLISCQNCILNGIHLKFMWGHVIADQPIQIVFRTREIVEPKV